MNDFAASMSNENKLNVLLALSHEGLSKKRGRLTTASFPDLFWVQELTS
ncbi:hypothetical protein [uncultured Sphingobacterium sp.]|nr:hypothetical protein [uncultured Sphingobacterium sp.]